MTSRERVMVALRGGVPDKVPFLDHLDAGMEARILGKDLYDQEDVAEAMHLDGLHYDGFFPPLFTDTAAGSGRKFLTRGSIRTRGDLARVQFPDPNDERYFDGAKRFLERHASSGRAVYLRTRMGAAGVLNSMGVDGFSYALADDPGLVEALFDRYVEWVITVLEKAQPLGFDFVWFFDDIAMKSGPLMSPGVFRELFLPRFRKVAGSLTLPWVYHSDGNLMPVLEDLLTLGMSALHPIEPGAMDIETVKGTYGHRVCIIGNIDLHRTLTLATVEEVVQEVRSRIERIGRGGGYIISSSNSITDYCRLANVLAFRDAVLRYRDYGADPGPTSATRR